MLEWSSSLKDIELLFHILKNIKNEKRHINWSLTALLEWRYCKVTALGFNLVTYFKFLISLFMQESSLMLKMCKRLPTSLTLSSLHKCARNSQEEGETSIDCVKWMLSRVLHCNCSVRASADLFYCCWND